MADDRLEGSGHYVPRPDGKVYYRKLGRGSPLVFLHAVASSGWQWRKVINSFAQHFTCYNVDLPGFDHSDIPPRKYEIPDFTQAVLDVMADAGVEKASLVGDHTGSMIAVDLAANHSHRVDRLVLDSLPYWSLEEGRAYFERHFIPQHTDTTSFDLAVAPFVSWEEAVLAEPHLPRELWAKREEIKRKSRRWIRLCQESNTSFDMGLVGPKVRAPTLLIYGEGERLRRSEERAHREIKGSILQVVPDCPGPTHEYRPQEFVRLALGFLQQG